MLAGSALDMIDSLGVRLKRKGFSDGRLAQLLGCPEADVRARVRSWVC